MKNLIQKWNSINLIKRIICGLIVGIILGLAIPQASVISILGDLFVGALRGIAPLLVFFFTASTHDYILFFTDRGRCYRKKGYLIPEAGRTARGVNIVNFIQVEKDEKVSAMLHVREMDDDSFLVFATRSGTVKRMALSALRNIRTSGIRGDL